MLFVYVELNEQYGTMPKLTQIDSGPKQRKSGSLGSVCYLPIDQLMRVSMKEELLPDVSALTDTYLQGNTWRPASSSSENGKRMLLIDEVDVFFGENFYGKTQHAAFDMRGPEVNAFLREIWTKQTQLDQIKHDKSRLLSALHTLEQLRLKYPKLDDSLLVCLVQGMLTETSPDSIASHIHEVVTNSSDDKENGIHYYRTASGDYSKKVVSCSSLLCA